MRCVKSLGGVCHAGLGGEVGRFAAFVIAEEDITTVVKLGGAYLLRLQVFAS